ncbi:MAG: acyl-protein synthetase [Candidatus Micrarchaeia archaeon]|jgi:phenylacetate-coenzyme A ligase PaaK-like adenylate-forming protein
MHQDAITLISQEQYHLAQAQKEKALLPILREQLQAAMQALPELEKYFSAWHFTPAKMQKISEIPPIPVSMFKDFDLRIAQKTDVVRVVKSSGTTGTQSRIYIGRETSARQTKALVSILKSFLGKTRMPYLVLDAAQSNAGSEEITARTAAIRGLAAYATETCYAMDQAGGELSPNFARVKQFCEKHEGETILVFGFTYIAWSRFLALAPVGEKFSVKSAFFLHSGGWKKLAAQKVDSATFDAAVKKVFQCEKMAIIDYYGMAESVGMIFPTCGAGFKHAPDFGDIIIRDPNTFAEAPAGQKGIIEVVSILPSSYPGNAILTEDLGTVMGIDDCKCGRLGKRFVFNERAPKAMARGCGDTFADKKTQQG